MNNVSNVLKVKLILISLLPVVGLAQMAETVFVKDFQSEGWLIGLALPASITEPTRVEAQSANAARLINLPQKETRTYELVWIPRGIAQTNVIWSVPKHTVMLTSGAPPFAFLDAMLTPEMGVFCIYRSGSEVFSIALKLTGENKNAWQEALRVEDGSQRDQVKFRLQRQIGTARLISGATPGELRVAVDSTEGSDLFVLEGGRTWRRLGPPLAAPFQKVFPGVGRLFVKESPVVLPEFPEEFEARRLAQRQSDAFQSLMKEVRFELKAYYTPRSLHRYEVFFLGEGESQPTRLVSLVSFFDPVLSRSPTGFELMDAIVTSDKVLMVFKEQARVCTLMKSLRDERANEQEAKVASEGESLTFTRATLSGAEGMVTLELRGSAPPRRFRFVEQRRWERLAWP